MDEPMDPHDGDADEYVSVASEGGYQNAYERGRDPNRKIISTSHCVEVFRQMRWTDPTHCGRQPPFDNKENTGGQGKLRKGKKGVIHASAPDSFCDVPSRMMRFDGAMEAWLQEIQIPLGPQRGVLPYVELNDAAERYTSLSVLKQGNSRAVIWYFLPEFLEQFWPYFMPPNSIGIEFWVEVLIEQGATVQSTHVPIGVINSPKSLHHQARNRWLKEIFAAMQTRRWTPNGEAMELLLKCGLTHAGMSIGDMIQIDSDLHVATVNGFVKIPEARHILPHGEMMQCDIQSSIFKARICNASEEEEEEEKKNGKEQVSETLTGKKSQKAKLQGDRIELMFRDDESQKHKRKMEKPQKKGPPKDRRCFREELQRRRKELNEISGGGG